MPGETWFACGEVSPGRKMSQSPKKQKGNKRETNLPALACRLTAWKLLLLFHVAMGAQKDTSYQSSTLGNSDQLKDDRLVHSQRKRKLEKRSQ